MNKHILYILFISLISLVHADYALADDKAKMSHQKSKILAAINNSKLFRNLNHENLYDPEVMVALNNISHSGLRKRLMLKVLDENNVSAKLKKLNEIFGIKLMEKKIKEKLLDKNTFTKTYTVLSLTNTMLPYDFFKQNNTQKLIKKTLQPALPLDQDLIEFFLKGVRSSTLNDELRDKNSHLPKTFEYGVKAYQAITTLQKELLSIASKDCIFDLTRLEDAIHTQSNFSPPHNKQQIVTDTYEDLSSNKKHTVTFISKVSTEKKYLGAMLTTINHTWPESIGKVEQAESTTCSNEYFTKRKTNTSLDQKASDEAYKHHISREMIMNNGRFLSGEVLQSDTPSFVSMDKKVKFGANELFIDLRPLEKECLKGGTQEVKSEKTVTQSAPPLSLLAVEKIVSWIRRFSILRSYDGAIFNIGLYYTRK